MISSSPSCIQNKGRSLLFSINPNDAGVEYCLSLGLDINDVDNEGNTILHVYVKEKTAYWREAILAMKKYGVDFERRNHVGLTALDCAVEVGREEDWKQALVNSEAPLVYQSRRNKK